MAIKRIVVWWVCMILWIVVAWCSIMHKQWSSITKDDITYQLINSYPYALSWDEMGFADSGTIVYEYHINDLLLGLEFDYRLYQRSKDQTITDEVKRVYSSSWDRRWITMKERWWRELYPINKKQRTEATIITGRCSITGLNNDDGMMKIFDTDEYDSYGYDFSDKDSNAMRWCLWIQDGKFGFPVFVTKKGRWDDTWDNTVLMIYRPEWIGGAYDKSTVSTLKWR